MPFYNFRAEGKAQTRAALPPGSGFVHHIESLCNAGKLFLWHSLSCVLHIKGEALPAFLLLKASQKLQRAAALHGFPSIVQEIQKDGLYQVRLHGDLPLLHKGLKPNGCPLQHRLQHPAQLLRQPPDVSRPFCKLSVADDQQIQKLKGEGFQPFSFLKDIIGRLEPLLLSHFPAPQHVGVADHGGQRGFQFMGKAPDEILLPAGRVLQLPELLFQIICHMVKIRRQLSNLVSRLHPGPALQVPARDALRRPGKAPQGPKEPGRQQVAAQAL